MKGKNNFLILVMFLFILLSCTEESIIEVQQQTGLTLQSKGNEMLKETIIAPDALPCGYKWEYVWELERYETKPGKIVGIWPHNDRMQNSTEIAKLKNKYGFNYILFADAYDLTKFNLVLSSGFARDKIIAQIFRHTYQQKISQYGTIYAYYADETLYNNWRMSEIIEIRNYIKLNTTNSKYFIGDWHRCPEFTEMVSYSDGCFYTVYDDRNQIIDCIYIEGSDDQRESWTDMKNRYQQKSISNWIGAHRDQSEYIRLLGHAYNLGLQMIWFYQLQDPYSDFTNIRNFCDAAWYSGWMRKFERRYRFEYECILPNPCDCNVNEPSHWILVEKIPTYEIREVIR
ncbi:MAG: hypothetical protein JXA68_10865 [Ignavibacteriales bacterium]|nr:hypothetical protein [Ignavibacteriales bacterium]